MVKRQETSAQMHSTHELIQPGAQGAPLGADRLSSEEWQFVDWAPRVQTIAVHFRDNRPRLVPLERDALGAWPGSGKFTSVFARFGYDALARIKSEAAMIFDFGAGRYGLQADFPTGSWNARVNTADAQRMGPVSLLPESMYVEDGPMLDVRDRSSVIFECDGFPR